MNSFNSEQAKLANSDVFFTERFTDLGKLNWLMVVRF